MTEKTATAAYVDVVFDGPPDHHAPRFVEVEDAAGRSIKVGEWVDRGDGTWALRLPTVPGLSEFREELMTWWANLEYYAHGYHKDDQDLEDLIDAMPRPPAGVRVSAGEDTSRG